MLERVLARLRFLPIPKNGSINLYQIKCAEAFRMLTVAYGEATLDRSNVYIHTYLAQTPEVGQDLGRFLSCGARKQEQT